MAPPQHELFISNQVVNFNRSRVVNFDRTKMVTFDRKEVVNLTGFCNNAIESKLRKIKSTQNLIFHLAKTILISFPIKKFQLMGNGIKSSPFYWSMCFNQAIAVQPQNLDFKSDPCLGFFFFYSCVIFTILKIPFQGY